MLLSPTTEREVTTDDLKRELVRRKARGDFDSFLKVYPPEKNFKRGRHTRDIIRICDEAIKKVEGGESQYLIVNVPFRHGKSMVGSQRLPVWSLIRNPDWEHIIATYNYSLSAEMSIKARNCFKAAAEHYGFKISDDRNQIGSWKLKDHNGGVFATGIGGTITGRGANVVIIDDYYKGIEEAESELVRDRVRHNFESNLMTRLKPVHLVIIIANRWHVDDLVGWIIQKNDPKSRMYDKKFPVFQIVKFPAWEEKHGWLFPEVYNDAWYEAVKSMIGSYAWSAQGLQEPQPRTGNLLKINKLEIVERDDWAKETDGFAWYRGWDLASTEKERIKDDPDFSVGTKVAYVNDHLYIDDVARGQWNGPPRDRKIKFCSTLDGPNVPIYIETVAGYKDAYSHVLELVAKTGAVVRKFNPSGKGDKVARATTLEAIFESGRVRIKRAPWNDEWLAEIGAFPAGRKDDQVDSLVVASYHLLNRGGAMTIQ